MRLRLRFTAALTLLLIGSLWGAAWLIGTCVLPDDIAPSVGWRVQALLIFLAAFLAVAAYEMFEVLVHRRLRQAVAVVEQVAADPASGPRLVVGRMSALRGLAEALNRMADAVRDSQRLLEQRVAERTADLQAEIAERKRAQEELDRRARDLEAARDLQNENAARLTNLVGQLQEGEAATRAILDTALDAIVTVDEQGRIREFNPAAERMFGYRRADVLNEPLADRILPPARRGQERRSLSKLLIDGTDSWLGRRLETVACRADGREFPVELAVTVRTGGVPLLTAYVRDLSQEQRAARMLAESNARLQAVLDAATQVAVIATDPAGLVTLFNTGAERMLGYRAAEVVGRLTPVILHEPEEVVAYARQLTEEFGKPVRGFDAFAERARRGGHDEREWTYVRKDGGRLRVNLAVTAILDEQAGKPGRITGYLCIATDVTERRRAAETLQRAKEAAEAASRAKSEFLANMSHEIRTPMNGILGMTELALDTELTPVQREYLDMVKASAESLLTVINDILDFSKIEAGKLDLDPVDFVLRDTLSETLRSLSLRAHVKGLELACHIPADVPDYLVGDPVRLRQILINLVGNGIKFTERGEVIVRVSKMEDRGSRIEDRESRSPFLSRSSIALHFSVCDTGIGIPADKLQMIFEPFVQADGSTTRKYGGTGLGLTITGRLVEMMGGRLWADSKPGKGSAFHFTVRLGLQDRSPSRLLPRRPSGLSGLSALVVDDNATSRQILVDMLQSWRLRPTAVADAGAALAEVSQAAAQGSPYGLAVIDAAMPGMDGFALAAELRSRPDWCGPAILLLSSPDRQGDLVRCRALGPGQHLAKPIKPSDLLDAILRVLAPPDGLHPATTDKAPEAPSPDVPAEVADRPPVSLRILLAEDNLVNQRLAVALLQRMGHQISVVENGAAAVCAVEQERFDLVFMDIQMPEMNGFEATAAIRAKERGAGRHLPIVALTAHAMKGDREECLRSGMDGYVSKPVQARRLEQAIDDVLDRFPTCGCTPAPFDPTPLLERLGGDLALSQELAHLFRAETPHRLEEMRAAVAAGDAALVVQAAHTFKGSAGTLGAAEVSAAARRLEHIGRAGNLDEAPAALRALEDLTRRLLAALEVWLAAQTQPHAEPAAAENGTPLAPLHAP
jgi:PAS domain S-box-containing protein